MNPMAPETPNNPSTPTPEENAAIQALENNDTSSATIESAPPAPAEVTPTPTPVAPAPTTVSPPLVGQDVKPAAAAIPTTESAPAMAPVSESDPAPVTPAFNPFEQKALDLAKKKKGKKPVVMLAVILLLAGLGAGGYYVWTLLQPSATTNPSTSNQTEESTVADPIETPEDVTSEVEAIEADINAIDETELQDATISDQTLNQ